MAEPRVQTVTYTNNVTGTVTRVNIRRNRTESETTAQLGRIMAYDSWRGNPARQRTIASAYARTETGMGVQGRIPGYRPYNFTQNRRNNRG